MAAQDVQIAGTEATAKLRSPVWVVVFSIITLGIYSIFWYYFINREMADLGRAKNAPELGDSPGKSVLAITLGALIIVPAIISIYNTFKRAHTAQKLVGVPPLNGWIALILILLLGPIAYAYLQSELNKVWRAVS
jgi:uncharacterized membrane protein